MSRRVFLTAGWGRRPASVAAELDGCSTERLVAQLFILWASVRNLESGKARPRSREYHEIDPGALARILEAQVGQRHQRARVGPTHASAGLADIVQAQRRPRSSMVLTVNSPATPSGISRVLACQLCEKNRFR